MKLKNMTAGVLAGFCLLGTSAAMAQSNGIQRQDLYVGGQVQFIDWGSYDPTGLSLNGGLRLNKFLAVEGRFGFNLDSDHGVKIKRQLGGYAKGILPVGNGFSVYGLLGANHVHTSGESDTGLSYGFGGEFFVNRNVAVNAEYIVLDNDTDYSKPKAVSVGLNYHF